jgi:hypothetical protein
MTEHLYTGYDISLIRAELADTMWNGGWAR